MKKLFTLAIVLLSVLVLTGCPNPIIPDEDVITVFPAFDGFVAARNISITLHGAPGTDAGAEDFYMANGPLLTGWEEGTFEIGTTYTTTILGTSVETVASMDGETIVYTGTFSDGEGKFEIRLNTDNSFTYMQRIVLVGNNWDSGTFINYVSSSLTGTRDGTNYDASGNCLGYASNGDGTGKYGFRYETSVKIRISDHWIGLFVPKAAAVDLSGEPDVSYASGIALEDDLMALMTEDYGTYCIWDNGTWGNDGASWNAH